MGYIPTPERDVEKTFLMAIEDVFSITGRGTVATGRIERGVVKVGENVEIVGVGDTQSTTITGIEMFQKTLDEGFAGDNVGILLRGVTREDIERGMVLSQTGAITAFTADDGTAVEMVLPGDRIKMTAELIYPVAIEDGMRFAIREGGRTIGAGVVSKIIK